MAVIKWVGAIVALVVVSVIVVGAAMYFRLIPIPGPILALLVGAKPPEYSARYYPPDTLAYAWVTLAPGGGQLEDMQEIWQRFNEYPAFRDLVDELQEEFEADTGIDFEEDVLPLAGPEISAGLLDFRSGIDEPIIVGMIAVRDQDAADDFLGKWLEYMEDSEGADFDTGSYLGIDIVIEEDGGQAYVLTKNWLVFATGESALELEPILITKSGLNWGNDQSERTQATPTEARWPGHTGQPHHRRFPDFRRTVGSAGASDPQACEHPSSGRRPAPSARPDLRQWHILRAAHRLPVEGAGRHGHLLRLHRSFALPGMGGRRGVPGTMASGAGTLRRIARSGLELAEPGRGADQSAPGRGKKPGPIPPTGVRAGSSAAC